MLADWDPVNEAILDTFGEEITYARAAGGPALAIAAVFDASEEAQLRTNGAAELLVRESDFAGTPPVEGDTVTVGGVTFTVVDVRPHSSLPADGGGRKLQLRKSPA